MLETFVIDQLGDILAIDELGDHQETSAPAGNVLGFKYVNVTLPRGQQLAGATGTFVHGDRRKYVLDIIGERAIRRKLIIQSACRCCC